MLDVAAGSNLYFVYSVLKDASNTSFIVNDSGRGGDTWRNYLEWLSKSVENLILVLYILTTKEY
jgi:hypothetical protein